MNQSTFMIGRGTKDMLKLTQNFTFMYIFFSSMLWNDVSHIDDQSIPTTSNILRETCKDFC